MLLLPLLPFVVRYVRLSPVIRQGRGSRKKRQCDMVQHQTIFSLLPSYALVGSLLGLTVDSKRLVLYLDWILHTRQR